MDRIKYGKYFYYVISVLLLITGLFGIKRLMTKADLPFSYSFQDNKIVSTEYYDIIKPGDVILNLDGINISSLFQLETILDEKFIEQETDLEIISTANTKYVVQVHLTRYYRNLNFILSKSFTCYFIFSWRSYFPPFHFHFPAGENKDCKLFYYFTLYIFNSVLHCTGNCSDLFDYG